MKIEDINNVVKNCYHDYYDLVEVEWTGGRVGHIPVPMIRDKSIYANRFLFVIPRSKKLRNSEFFKCPLCGEPSFYTGICYSCESYNNTEIDDYYEYKEYLSGKKKYLIKCITEGLPLPKSVVRVEYVFTA